MHFRKNMTLEILEAETPLRALHRMRNDLLRMELAIGSSVFAAGLLPALQAWSAFAAGIPEGAFEAGIRRARRMMELMLDEALPDGLDPKARERLRLGRLAGGMLLGLLSAADDILQFEFKALENGRASDTSPAFDPSAELLLEFQIACAAKGRKAVAEALPAMRASKRIELERAGLCEFLLRRLIDRNIAALLREAREGGLEPALRHAAGGFPGADEEAVRFERILMKALSEECRKASFPALMPGGESSEASDAFFTREVRSSFPARFSLQFARSVFLSSRGRTTARTSLKRSQRLIFHLVSGLQLTASFSSGPKARRLLKPFSAAASGWRRKRTDRG